MTTKSLSKEALSFTTEDYEIRIVDVPDTQFDSKDRRIAYGVFNRHTNVREGVTDQLALAVAAVASAQKVLANIVRVASENIADVEVTPTMPGFNPPSFN